MIQCERERIQEDGRYMHGERERENAFERDLWLEIIQWGRGSESYERE